LYNLDEEYQISVYKGIRAEAAALGLDLICVQGETLNTYLNDPKSGFLPSREFIAADGILLLTSALMNRSKVDTLHDLKRRIRLPLVSVGSHFMDYPSIMVRSHLSMHSLMEHLILFHGYRKLLYVGGPKRHRGSLVREQVFSRTVGTFKDRFPGMEGKVIRGELSQTSAIRIIQEYIAIHPDAVPDAIVAATDNMAIGALQALRNQEDPRWHNCPITGFDDIAAARRESLTTIRQPLDEMGKLAVRTLRDMIQGKKVNQIIHMESELCIRNSCGCTAAWETQEKEASPENSAIEKSEYRLQNVSLLGETLVTVNLLHDIFPALGTFLSHLSVKAFYFILYPEPLEQIGKTGKLVYQRIGDQDYFPPDQNKIIKIKDFFSPSPDSPPQLRCVHYLRSGKEYLGLIVYEVSDRAHPQICSAVNFMGNTIKRLQIHEYEQKQAQRMEQEISLRTRELAEAYKKLQEEVNRRMAVETEVLRISELERLRFSMDLHDDICQRMAGISMFCKSHMPGAETQTFLRELSSLIDETLARTRRYAHDSFPLELDALGLKEALNALCHTVTKQTSCTCVFSWIAPEISPFSAAQDLNIYRIIQEALQNAVKHAKANLIKVQIQSDEKAFLFCIQDNGTGDPQLNEETSDGETRQINRANSRSTDKNGRLKKDGLGLRSMRYRAHQLGAQYFFESSEEDGTRVEIHVPLNQK
jgi:signal transduction histidine kinase/DNA-binding LacI/PurR family transcriptional regulator